MIPWLLAIILHSSSWTAVDWLPLEMCMVLWPLEATVIGTISTNDRQTCFSHILKKKKNSQERISSLIPILWSKWHFPPPFLEEPKVSHSQNRREISSWRLPKPFLHSFFFPGHSALGSLLQNPRSLYFGLHDTGKDCKNIICLSVISLPSLKQTNKKTTLTQNSTAADGDWMLEQTGGPSLTALCSLLVFCYTKVANWEGKSTISWSSSVPINPPHRFSTLVTFNHSN